MKTNRTYDVRLGTGLWGQHTAEHTAHYIKEAIASVRKTTSTLTAKQYTVSNDHIVVEAQGTEKQLAKLAREISWCVITVNSVKEQSI